MSDPNVDRERETRQLCLMLDRLRGFERGEIDIAKTIADLEGLLWALELASEDWRDAFVEEWSELEIAYAVALDRVEPMPDASDPAIRQAVKRMVELVEERLAASA